MFLKLFNYGVNGALLPSKTLSFTFPTLYITQTVGENCTLTNSSFIPAAFMVLQGSPSSQAAYLIKP